MGPPAERAVLERSSLSPPNAPSPEDMVLSWYAEATEIGRGPIRSKDEVRNVHLRQRKEHLNRSLPFLLTRGEEALADFADGSEIVPDDIEPRVVPVLAGSREADVFRLATLWWSVPVSQGFGRRQRFLVRDGQNEKLIGILALGDPVFNLSARDEHIGWTSRHRELRLKYVTDAFVLGALPPYSSIMGGRLVAAIATSREVEEMFCRKYRGQRTVIREKRQAAQLALLTTSSVFGRSSVYARLRVNDRLRFQYVGTTKGFGHFQVPTSVFRALVHLLEKREHPYAHGNRFGNGPNWKMRVIRTGLQSLGLDPSRLHHGVQRGIYVAPLADDYTSFLCGRRRDISKTIQDTIPVIAETIKRRWVIPRASRTSDWKTVGGASQIKNAVNSVAGEKIL